MREVWIVNNVGGQEFFYAWKESGLSQVFEDAWGTHEVHKATIFESEEDKIVGSSQRKKEIRWVVVYDFTFLFFSHLSFFLLVIKILFIYFIPLS